MRGFGVISLVALVACSGSSVAVVTPPPIDANTQTVILAIEAGDQFEVHALSATNGAIDSAAFPIKLARPIEEGTRVRFEALRYTKPLSAFGLASGPLESSTSTRSAPLPAGRVMRMEMVAGDDPNSWRETDDRSVPLSDFQYTLPRTACRDFAISVGNLPGQQSPVLSGRIGPNVAMIGTDNEDFFLVRDKDQVTRAKTMIVPNFHSMWVPEPGVIWFGSYQGQLVKARLDTELIIEEVHATANRGRVYWISGAPGLSNDIFTLSPDGIVEHFDGARSRIVHRFPGLPPEESTGGVSWVGPYEAIVAWHSVQAVTRVKRDPISLEWHVLREETPDATAAFIATTFSPRFGQLASNSDGQFFVQREGRWQIIPDSPLRVWAYHVTPYEDGFLYGGAFGAFGQYSPVDGFCPLQINVQATDVRHMVVLESGSIVTSGPTVASPSFTWIEPR